MKFQSRFILFNLFFVLFANAKSSQSFFEYYDEDPIIWEDYADSSYETTSVSSEIEFVNIFNLTNKHFPILNDYVFENNYNLTKIILKNNKIQFIDVNTFDKFNNTLQYLELTSNNLSTFNIQPIQSLKELNLSNNSLTILNSTSFQKLNLNKLDVSSNNLTVVYCFNVHKSINLSHNNISNICNFSKSIVDINLSYNNIKYIQNYTFKELTKLNHLYLNHNEIVTIQYEIFTNHLSVLNLSHNIFTELDLLQFKHILSLETLDLSYNNISIVHQYPKLRFENPDRGLTLSRYYSIEIPNYFSKFHRLHLEGNPIKKINITNLSEICYSLNVLGISFSEISCSMLQNYISEFPHTVLKGPVINTENIHGIECDSSLNTLNDSDSIDSMLILLNKVNAILIVLAFFFVIFVIVSIIVTVKRYRANINSR